jgi:hypothetical protein
MGDVAFVSFEDWWVDSVWVGAVVALLALEASLVIHKIRAANYLARFRSEDDEVSVVEPTC